MNRVVQTLLIVALAQAMVMADEALVCDPESEISLRDWQHWTKVTPAPVRSEGHSNNWVRIYVDDRARDTYLSIAEPYPECAKIVKPVYTDEGGKTIRKLTVMVKMRAGYDPDNADWWYGVYDPSGTMIERHGKLADCIACHKLAVETDYLFSKEVLGTDK